MLCEWLKCNEQAVIEWCEKLVCKTHVRAIDDLGPRYARRVLNVDDMVPTRFRFIGVQPFRWPRNIKSNKKTIKAKPIF